MSSPLQHYVPQFLLSHFGHGEKRRRIYVFDKSNRGEFPGAVKKLAAERKFYDFRFKGVPLTLEPSLAELESETAQCVKVILEKGRLSTLTEPGAVQERGTIIRFLAVQIVRTAGALARANELAQNLGTLQPHYARQLLYRRSRAN
jgi:Protein of unknown function (DUF4238)